MDFIIATGNPHKVAEFSRMLIPLGFSAVSAKEAGISLDAVEENGLTFEENAFIKARFVCEASGKAAIADDSGLCVDALGGRPGIYSARYAPTDRECIEKLLSELKDVPEKDRTARFVSCICCVLPDGRHFTVRGESEGLIAFAPRGDNDFGYDPIFLSGDKTFGEMTAAEKDAVSHRARALDKFVLEIKNYV